MMISKLWATSSSAVWGGGAMVINGASRRDGAQLALYLARPGQRVHVLDIRGTLSRDIHGALCEMDDLASGSRCQKHLYHVNINTHPGERLSPDQWQACANRLGLELRLDGHQRVIVLHEQPGKDGVMRQHAHVVWNRVDGETLRAPRMSWSYRDHERAARVLERELGHRIVPGPHIDPVSLEVRRTPFEPLPPLGVEKVGGDLTAAWGIADSGKAWASAIEDKGYILARGDKRDFVVLDAAGEIHSPRRRIEGVRAKDIRDRLSDLDPTQLPSIDDARQRIADRARMALEQSQEGHSMKQDLDDRKPSAPETEAPPVRATYGDFSSLSPADLAALDARLAKLKGEPTPEVSRKPSPPALSSASPIQTEAYNPEKAYKEDMAWEQQQNQRRIELRTGEMSERHASQSETQQDLRAVERERLDRAIRAERERVTRQEHEYRQRAQSEAEKEGWWQRLKIAPVQIYQSARRHVDEGYDAKLQAQEHARAQEMLAAERRRHEDQEQRLRAMELREERALAEKLERDADRLKVRQDTQIKELNKDLAKIEQQGVDQIHIRHKKLRPLTENYKQEMAEDEPRQSLDKPAPPPAITPPKTGKPAFDLAAERGAAARAERAAALPLSPHTPKVNAIRQDAPKTETPRPASMTPPTGDTQPDAPKPGRPMTAREERAAKLPPPPVPSAPKRRIRLE
jgi:hypothetical protein